MVDYNSQAEKMNRPYVNLSSENTIQKMLDALYKSLDKFIALDGVVGVTLNGGLSRGYGDYLSEIDITIFLHEKQFNEYKNGKYPFALFITVIDGFLYDIKTVSYEQEIVREYENVTLWDLSYAKILYDPKDKIADLIKQKLSKTVDISKTSDLLWSAFGWYKLAGDIWIHRQDGVQGHYVLNNAITPLLSTLFTVNNEYIPHEKWLVHMSKSLTWKPDDWEARLMGAMSTGDFSIISLKERQSIFEGLWIDINSKVCELTGFHTELNFTQKHSYETLIKLLEKSEYTISEWEAVSSLESLNYEPMHKIFKRVGDKIVLDKNSFLSIKPEDMYVWMYEIANETRKKFDLHSSCQ